MRIIICDDNPHDIHTYSIIVKNVLKQADIDAELLLYELDTNILLADFICILESVSLNTYELQRHNLLKGF